MTAVIVPPTAPDGRWPASAEDRRDHARVVDLITRVGWSRIHFSLDDVADAMNAPGAPRLADRGSLARHVALLPESLVRRVDFRYSVVRGVGGPSAAVTPRVTEAEGGPPAAGSLAAATTLGRPHYYYVLTERLDEHRRAPRPPDEYERAYLALWVATLTLGVESVPTSAVTDVARAVLDLRLPENLQTSHFLTPLITRTVPLAEKESGADGGRWVRWRPLGERPADPRLDAWLAAYGEARRDTAGAHAAGGATLSELARRLVVHAVSRTRSKEWPAGRSVQVREIEAAAVEEPDTAALLGIIREGGRSLALVLSDAARPRVAGAKRVQPRVIRLAAVVGSQTYYDVPDLEGFERRRLIVPLKALRAEITLERLKALTRERRDATQLAARASSDALRAVAAARAALVHDVLDAWGAALSPLLDTGALLSKTTRAAVQGLAARLTTARREAGEARPAIAAAEAALARVGLSWSGVRAAARPLATPREMAPWLPAAARERGSASLTLANHTTLRRYARPPRSVASAARPRGTPGAGRAVAYAVDRVDALVQLADRGNGRAGAALRAGARLLGPNLRDARLVRCVLDDARARHAAADWTAALAGLVLLGDEAAVAVAERALHDTLPPVWHEHALYALLVMRSVDPARWPATVRFSRDPATRSVVQRVTTAARREHWLGG